MPNSKLKTFSSEFCEKEQEQAFRESEFHNEAIRFSVLAILLSISMAVYIKNDIHFVGWNMWFYALLGVRASVVGLTIWTLWHVWKNQSFVIVYVWAASIAVFFTFVNFTRPPDYIANVVQDVVFILFCYVFIPFGFWIRMAFGMSVSLVEIVLLLFYRTEIPVTSSSAIVVAIVAVNFLGVFFVWNSGKRKREKFSAIHRETALKEDLHRYALELEVTNRDLESFSSMVAHDLRSPLGAMLGFGELLRIQIEKNPELNEECGKIIDRLIGSGRRMDGIINSLLTLARLRTDVDVQMHLLDMSNIIERVEERLCFEIEKSKAIIHKPNLWPSMYGYTPWLDEVMANFIDNAIKYGGHPPVVTISFEQKTGVRVYVSDNGIGVPDDRKITIFQESVRGEHEHIDGCGMGLSIVKRVAKKMKTAVGVDDVSGGGSRFWIDLPTSPPVNDNS